LIIIKNIFNEFISYNVYVAYILLALLLYFIGISIINIKKRNKLVSNKFYFSVFFLLTWIFVFTVIMYIKSVVGNSVFLHRYLISILPALLLFIALLITSV